MMKPLLHKVESPLLYMRPSRSRWCSPRFVITILVIGFWTWIVEKAYVHLTGPPPPPPHGRHRHHLDRYYEDDSLVPSYTDAVPRMARISMLYGKTSAAYERAMATHLNHAAIHRNPVHILTHPITEGLWNKPMYMLSVMAQELAKPPGKRVEWLMWFDMDTIILNYVLPAEMFLPPRHDGNFSNIDMILTKDFNGINTGVFFLRVSQWSLDFLKWTISYPDVRPEVDLGKCCVDQTAMYYLLLEPRSKGHTMFVPQTWINSYADLLTDDNLLVHFAGQSGRDWKMNEWLEIVENPTTAAEWARRPEDTNWPAEVAEYWTTVKSEWAAIDQFKRVMHAKNLVSEYHEFLDWYENIAWYWSDNSTVMDRNRPEFKEQLTQLKRHATMPKHEAEHEHEHEEKDRDSRRS